ncbi:glycine cleavage system protein GcvH [Pantoea sp. 1.19]|uniref:glycine cleavage system protein GcvH n=1 Tax=Pantoea sp. 1.19 TaxID=1925589 RepID=UPI000948B2D7|nr:glycine cleavage system protein GcvH [Pantoea sp. 1.19]
MSNVPNSLKYSAEHEWVRAEGEGVYVVGITHHAQELLGDVVFVEVTPAVGEQVNANDTVGVVESVKAASDIYSPISGEILEVNAGLDGSPETVNGAPYADGWIYKIKASDESEVAALLDAAAYSALIAE